MKEGKKLTIKKTILFTLVSYVLLIPFFLAYQIGLNWLSQGVILALLIIPIVSVLFVSSVITKLILLALMPLLVMGGMNFSGYCLETNSWLSEEELVRQHLEWINKPRILETHPSHLTVIPYKNIDEMLDVNPDVIIRGTEDFKRIKGEYIRTDEGAHAPSIISRLTGEIMVRISLAPRQNVIDHADGKEKTVRLLYNLPLNNCGKQWHYD